MSDRQLRQQHQDVTSRLREQRLEVERHAATDRALLAAFYARRREQQAAANTTT